MAANISNAEKNRIIVQWLSGFTVSIHQLTENDGELTSDTIVGTGIAVSTDGQVVTCAHMLKLAGINPREHNGAEIGVYFPQARSDEKKSHSAVIVGHFPQHDDDVVLLKLKHGPTPLAPE